MKGSLSRIHYCICDLLVQINPEIKKGAGPFLMDLADNHLRLKL
jgi:hypothetical protein